MIRLLIAGLILTFLLAGAAFLLPVSVILEVSGAAQNGLSWMSAEGTLARGRIRQIRRDGTLIGDAQLSWRPQALIRLVLSYDVTWTGPAGTGQARLEAGTGGELALRDFQASLDLARIDGLALWMRHSAAEARIDGRLIRFSREGCLEAEGHVHSDALSRNEAFLGTDWSDLTGNLECRDSALFIPVTSRNEAGITAHANARLRPGADMIIEASITGDIPEDLRHLAELAGFVRAGDGLTYETRISDAPADQGPGQPALSRQ